MENVFYKDRFKVISEEKQKKILDAAVEEFSSNGFNGTNINKVAKRAGISIGAMYSYFDSKDDLYLTVVERMFGVLSKILSEVEVKKDIYEIVEDLFMSAHKYAVSHPQLNQIYLDMSTQSLSKLSRKLSGSLETITKNLYIEVIERARKEKKIIIDVDDRILAFLIDNLVMMYQFSFTSEYYKGRMEIFLGQELTDDYEKQIKQIVKFIKNALTK